MSAGKSEVLGCSAFLNGTIALERQARPPHPLRDSRFLDAVTRHNERIGTRAQWIVHKVLMLLVVCPVIHLVARLLLSALWRSTV